jgi:aspartate ammonia-lyase
MPRVRWTPEEDERLVGLIAAGKSWTSISGTLKRSMKSVELHANTLRLVGAKKERGLKESRTARLQAGHSDPALKLRTKNEQNRSLEAKPDMLRYGR